MLKEFKWFLFHKKLINLVQVCTGKSIDTEITGIQESLCLLPTHPWKVISQVLTSCVYKDSWKIVLSEIKTLLLTTKSRNLILAKNSAYTIFDFVFPCAFTKGWEYINIRLFHRLKTRGLLRVLHDFYTPRVEWLYIQWQPMKEYFSLILIVLIRWWIISVSIQQCWFCSNWQNNKIFEFSIEKFGLF